MQWMSLWMRLCPQCRRQALHRKRKRKRPFHARRFRLLLRRLRLRLEVGPDEGLAFDFALTDQPQRERRADEAEQRAEQQDLVEAVDEALFGGAAGDVTGPGRDAGQCLRQSPRGARFDQLMGLVAADGAAGRALHLGGADAEEDRSPGGDPDRDPDLAEGVVDPRRHPALLFRDDAEGDVGDHRVDNADPDAADDEPGQQRRPFGVDVEAARQHQADADQG